MSKSSQQPSFTCPHCKRTSYNPNDVRTGYCANCHTFPEQRAAADAIDNTLREVERRFDDVKRLHKYYRLDSEGEPEPCTFGQWAVFLENSRDARVLKQGWIANVWISTVFLGLDHSFGGPIPILWETMTFSNDAAMDKRQDRCGGSREQAEAMHARMEEEVAKFQREKQTQQSPKKGKPEA